MKAYSNMLQTTFALFQMLLGSFSVEEILGSNKYVGPIFFTFFMILIFILLVNFLVTIICDAIASGVYVAHDHDQELSDYIWRSFQELFGFYVPPGTDEITDDAKEAKLNSKLDMVEDSLDEVLDITRCLLQYSKMDMSRRPHPVKTCP
ncbi:uncharacterized protein LOC144906567 [Branchiostoma floridae x Branchiostoma belcheri]